MEAKPTAPEPTPSIYEHVTQPSWGRGILTSEQGDKRFISFEDGKERIFARDHWSKLSMVSLGEDEAAALVAKIRALIAPRSSGRSRPPRTRTPKAPPMPFEAQVALFQSQFPGGFGGEAFVERERGRAEMPTKQAYKAAAIARARELLTPEALAGEPTQAFALVQELLLAAKPMLFPQSDLLPLAQMTEEHQGGFAQALRTVLHGPTDAEGAAGRFDQLIAAIHVEPKRPTWPMVTIMPALYAPERFLFVKPTVLQLEAAIIGQNVDYAPNPTGAIYQGFVAVAEEVKRRLEAAGQQPRDLMDVYSFIATTLAKK
jgi:hypothetical protein